MTRINEKSEEQSVPNINNKIENDLSDLYPGRKRSKTTSWMNTMFQRKHEQEIVKLNCEKNVYNCVKDSALVKLMLAALKSAGCEIDIRRHISCEICDSKVTGGYDPQLNQIIVCQNNVASEKKVQGVLTHEMIHMFDYCRNNMDLNNIDHLACTEIRAANLCHCSFLGAWVQGLASPFNVKEMHKNCVQDMAIRAILAVRKVSDDDAREAVLRVFDKCYNDLEPIGRRLRRNSHDMSKAYMEGPLYGYMN